MSFEGLKLPAENENEKSGFDRQRRNLTLSWAALFFYQTVNPQLDRLILPGQIGVIVPSPEILVFWMVGLLFYFLIRYHQYFNSTVVDKAYKEVRKRLFQVLEEYAKERARAVTLRERPDVSKNMTFGQASVHEFTDVFSVVNVSNGMYFDNEGKMVTLGSGQSIRVSGIRFWWFRQKALLLTSWDHPYFTEYYLPFVLPHVCWMWAVWA